MPDPKPDDLPDPNEPDEISLEMVKREFEIQQAAHAGQRASAFWLALTMAGADEDTAATLTAVWIETKL